MITKRQYELLIYIYTYQSGHGYAPTYTEMAAALGAKSRGHLQPMVTRLVERGYVRRVAGSARGIEVVRIPRAARAVGSGS